MNLRKKHKEKRDREPRKDSDREKESKGERGKERFLGKGTDKLN